jgi:hypothetical protein
MKDIFVEEGFQCHNFFYVIIYHQLGVSIIDPIRLKPDLTRYVIKINGSGINLIFLTRIGSGRIRVNPTRLIIFLEVIL